MKKLECVGVDIGNSGLRITLLDPDSDVVGASIRVDWTLNGSLTIKSKFVPSETRWLREIEEFLHKNVIGSRLLWLVSSVRRDATQVLQGFVAARSQDRWHLVTRVDVDLEIDVLEPDRVGVDRLLAASAAINLTAERPLIVMQAGSALTVDLVTDRNCFRGGAILPGIPMMLRLLGRAADMLPELEAVELFDLPKLPGRNTEEAMKCGTASAMVGGAQHLTERYREQFGEKTLIVLSGGDGFRLASHLSEPIRVVPQLVLRGLLPIARRLS